MDFLKAVKFFFYGCYLFISAILSFGRAFEDEDKKKASAKKSK